MSKYKEEEHDNEEKYLDWVGHGFGLTSNRINICGDWDGD